MAELKTSYMFSRVPYLTDGTLEHQMNFFATAIFMPRPALRTAFREFFNLDAYVRKLWIRPPRPCGGLG